MLAGIALALITGPLGCFIVWRRMAYFGDTLAHAALLGIALGILLDIPNGFAVIAACLLVGLLMLVLQRQQHFASDTVLGILAHSSLSVGLIAIALLDSPSVDLMGYLFGDILTTGWSETGFIAVLTVVSLLVLIFYWRRLILITLHEDLARVEGVNPMLSQIVLISIIAFVIAMAMKVVGLLLVTSMLIIPAAAARPLSRSPGMMAILAGIIGAVSVIAGLFGAWWIDAPSGPSIVLASFLCFLATFIGGRFISR
ncbi:iron chelate uptake ABC transporter family permease subunit [Allohahella marinimesophila]